MDIDKALLSAVLRTEGGFFAAKRGGVTGRTLQGEAAIKGWNFINDHVLEFGKVPSEELFRAKTGVVLIDVEDELGAIMKEIRGRALWNKLRGVNDELASLLGEKKVQESLEFLQASLRETYKDGIGMSRVESLLSLGDEVIAHYERMKDGERGIQTPWAAMNDMTLGWWGGDFVVFAARMGVGKTFTMLMLARHAWMEGKTVLFVGTEMSRIKLAIRFYALHLKLPYRELRMGELGEFREDEFKQGVRDVLNSDGLYVVGDDFDASIEEIEAAIEEIHPDILFVDGLYLVKNEGRDRHARVSNTADDLKRLARRKDIPVITSTQFNRDVAQNSKSAVNAANVGITDVIGWNADVMFGMYQTEDMDEDGIMGFRPIKIREGKGRDFYSNWKFKDMNFDQRDEDSSGSFKDEDYDGVAGAVSGDDWEGDDDQGALF